jgi:hypothetical protein
MSDHFVKVFDVLDSGFKDWYFPAWGLIFVLVGVLGFAFSPERSGLFRYGIFGFAILWAIFGDLCPVRAPQSAFPRKSLQCC